MISGDGFFAVRSGGETLYTRAGGFSFDPTGKMVTADGSVVQGWSAQDGVVNTGQATGNIVLPLDAVSPAKATTAATVTGNLPSTAATGDELVRDVTVYDAQGTPSTLTAPAVSVRPAPVCLPSVKASDPVAPLAGSVTSHPVAVFVKVRLRVEGVPCAS